MPRRTRSAPRSRPTGSGRSRRRPPPPADLPGEEEPANPIASASAESAAKTEWPRNDGCRRPAAHASAMSTPKNWSSAKHVAARSSDERGDEELPGGAAPKEQQAAGASSAYSENFAAVTRCSSEPGAHEDPEQGAAEATQSGSAGRRGANPERSPSRSAASATTRRPVGEVEPEVGRAERPSRPAGT